MQNLSEPIEENDTRAIISILTDVYAMEGPQTNKKRRLLDLLSAYISANKWITTLRVQESTDDGPKFVGLLHGGFEPKQLARITEAAAQPIVKDIDSPFAEELNRQKVQITLRLEDFDLQQQWPGSYAAELAAQAGIGTFISSARPFYDDNGTMKSSSIALYRAPGEPPFSERERRIAHIVLSEVGWLHTDGWPSEYAVEATSSLPRSHLPMLSLLVHGNSRKEIAKMTQLSIHTVNSYIKEIFCYFDVNSQIALMKLFIYGDGNDQLRRQSPVAPPSLPGEDSNCR